MDTSVELRAEKANANALITHAEAAQRITVSSPEDERTAAAAAAWAHETLKAIKDRQAYFLAPLQLAESRIKEVFAPAIHALEKGKANCKAQLATYAAHKERANREAMEAAAKAARAGDAAAMSQAVAQAVPTAPPEQVRYQEVWTPEVTAPELVPREFLCVDMAALKRHAASNPGVPVPGVVFTKTLRPVMRGSR